MPTAVSDGVELFYTVAGEGETVAFIGEAGYGAWQWAWQFEGLAGPYEALVWDLRGTGRSDAPAQSYDVSLLAADLEAVLRATGTAQAHLVGTGLGGMIALAYASRYNRARSLTVVGTAADGTALHESAFRALHAPPDDPEALRRSLRGAFSEAFLSHDALVERIIDWRSADDASVPAFERQAAAALAFEADALYELTLPTLVCHGVDDPVVPIEAGKSLADRLPRGEFEAVAGRHLCAAEHARAVTDRLFAFFEQGDGYDR